MKTQKKHRLVIISLILTIFLINGCGNEDTPDPVFDAPVLSISGQSSALLKPGDAIEVSFTLDADAGNQTLRVNRGGGILDLVSLDEDATTFTYSGATVSGDLTEGEMEEFEFILIDAADQQSTPVTFTADIAVYDLITVKGEEMYEVAIPADGIVSALVPTDARYW